MLSLWIRAFKGKSCGFDDWRKWGERQKKIFYLNCIWRHSEYYWLSINREHGGGAYLVYLWYIYVPFSAQLGTLRIWEAKNYESQEKKQRLFKITPCPDIFCVQKDFRSKKTWCPENFGTKNFWSKKILDSYWTQNLFARNLAQKISYPKILGSRNFGVQKYCGPKRIWWPAGPDEKVTLSSKLKVKLKLSLAKLECRTNYISINRCIIC